LFLAFHVNYIPKKLQHHFLLSFATPPFLLEPAVLALPITRIPVNKEELQHLAPDFGRELQFKNHYPRCLSEEEAKRLSHLKTKFS